MQRVLAILLSLATLSCLWACGDNPGQAAAGEKVFRSLKPVEAKALIESKKDLAIIDVRSPEELVHGSIPGAKLIPFTELAKGRASLPEGRPLLLVCAVGGRSYAVGRYFSGNGYREIYNLEGGISAWKAAGLPLAR